MSKANRNKKIVCFGEVLWDIFPNGEKLGGAPFNVCQRLASLGNKAVLISAIGQDDLGKRILDYFDKKKLDKSFIQESAHFPTGQVLVSLDSKGSPSYEILQPVAWDHIQYSDDMGELVAKSDAFVFGSLASRNPISRQCLLRLIDKSSFSVFDLNLRSPFYSLDFICELLKKVDLAKFNDEEIIELAEYLSREVQDIDSAIYIVQEKFNLKRICVTLGSEGAAYIKNGKQYRFHGFKVKVADTVGAGDSFLAGFVHELLKGSSPYKSLKYACAVGAMVASSEGANPDLNEHELARLMNEAKD